MQFTNVFWLRILHRAQRLLRQCTRCRPAPRIGAFTARCELEVLLEYIIIGFYAFLQILFRLRGVGDFEPSLSVRFGNQRSGSCRRCHTVQRT